MKAECQEICARVELFITVLFSLDRGAAWVVCRYESVSFYLPTFKNAIYWYLSVVYSYFN